VGSDIMGKVGSFRDSSFIGYETLESQTILTNVLDNRFVALDRTPFYVESGGQVDDTGVIEGEHFRAEVLDSYKHDRKIIHEIRVLEGDPNALIGHTVAVRVDRERRRNIQRNHSATHIVHEALRRVLGSHVHQQGSLVAPDRLRFDFPHFGKITPEELHAIEDIVNQKIADDIPVYTEVDLPIEQARKIPNVKMFFGDKYGDTVRVVFIEESFSVEFCGGTHVSSTNDIGLFKIISESSIASGVRRIEAVTGEGLMHYVDGQVRKAGELDERLERLLEEKENLERELGHYTAIPSSVRPSIGRVTLPTDRVTRTTLAEVDEAVRLREAVIEQQAHDNLQIAKELSKLRVRSASPDIERLVSTASRLDGFNLVAAQVRATSMDELKSLGDTLRVKLISGVGILASVIDEKVALVCVVTDDLITGKKLQAGKIVGAVAKLVGGGGGGKPHLATAGGKDVDRLDDALKNVAEIVHSMM